MHRVKQAGHDPDTLAVRGRLRIFCLWNDSHKDTIQTTESIIYHCGDDVQRHTWRDSLTDEELKLTERQMMGKQYRECQVIFSVYSFIHRESDECTQRHTTKQERVDSWFICYSNLSQTQKLSIWMN